MQAASLIRAAEQTQTPWRYRLDELAWRDLVQALAHDRLPFAGLWCDGQDVHALFLPDGQPLAATVALEDGRYPALSPVRPVSSLYERAAYDLYGAEAMWAVDVRPLLDHDVWQASTPLAQAPGLAGGHKGLVRFQPSEQFLHGAGDVDGWGPATGGMVPPLHVRLALQGGRILRAESQTGYAHRGLALRWRNTRLDEACRLSGRVSAGVSVAHQVAFCMAVENACGVSVAAETGLLRVALLEMERVSHHLYTLAKLARLAGADVLASRSMGLREALLAAIAPVTGSRLLMDVCQPGGVRLAETMRMGELCGQVCDLAQGRIPALASAWRDYPGLGARLASLGAITRDDVGQLGLEGLVARASGGDCDHRRAMPSYAGLWRYTSAKRQGTAEDRAFLLLDEVVESLRMLGIAADQLGLAAADYVDCQADSAEGAAMVEGPWGPVLYWVRLSQGRVAHVFQHGPEQAALLLFENALSGHSVEDLPLLACSLGVNAAALDA